MSKKVAARAKPKPWGIYDAEGKIIFEPSVKQEVFLNSIKPYLLYGGSRGSGKSFAAIFKAIFTCLRIPGCSVCIVRKTYAQLEQSIIGQFNLLPSVIYSNDPYAFNRSNNIVSFDNGSKLYFRSCANVDVARNLFKGSSFVCIIVDELTEFSYAEWSEMIGGCRCPIKQDIYGDPVICQMIGLTNPGGQGHIFVKSLFVDKQQVPGQDPDSYNENDYEFVKAFVEDNPVYGKDKDYMAKLESLPIALRAVYRYGDWSVFSGQYFSNYDPQATMIDEDIVIREMAKQSWQPCWISIDWGYVHHAVVQWHVSLDINKQQHHITYRELIVKEMGEAALGQEIARYNQQDKISHVYLSPDCFGDSVNSRAKLIGNQLVQYNIPRPIPANNERVDGWRLLSELINDRPRSKALISTACPELIKAIPLLIRNTPTKPDDIKKIDQIEDDIGDCWRYGMMSKLSSEEKPKSYAYAESKLAAIEEKNFQRAYFLELEYNAANKRRMKAHKR